MTNLVPPGGFSPVSLPRLADELRSQVDRLIAGPARYDGIAGTDDPGFVLANDLTPEFHPDAERVAAQLRAARNNRPDLARIVEWFEPLTIAVANPPSEARFRAYASVAARACGDFSLAVWEATNDEAVRSFRFWPSIEEVNKLLEREDARQLAELTALDDIAKGTRTPRGPAREAKGYDPGPAHSPSPPHPSMPKHDPAADLVRIDPASVEAQLTALGYTRDTLPPLQPRQPKLTAT